MDEKYVITIDGPDYTGKSTLWLKANEYNKNMEEQNECVSNR